VTAISRQIVGRRRQDAGSHRSVAIEGDAPKRTRSCSALLRSRAGKLADRHLSTAHNLEFLREARAIRDFIHPARTLIGACDGATAITAAQFLASDAPLPENVQVIRSGSKLKPSRPWRGQLIGGNRVISDAAASNCGPCPDRHISILIDRGQPSTE
jgi:hypothetical protein